MKKRLFLLLLSGLLLASPSYAFANNAEESFENEIEVIEESEALITSGGVYNLTAPSHVEGIVGFEPFHYSGNSSATAPAGATITTGGGRFWSYWPRIDRLVAHHSNPTWMHRSSACNHNGCVRSHGTDGWRLPNRTGSARAFTDTGVSGNSAHWATLMCDNSRCW